MKKTMLVGRNDAGKTTLTQAMKGRRTTYHETQYTNNHDVIISTPGEYVENKTLARALVLYPYEADIVGLLMNAIKDYSLCSPHIVSMVAREAIGIVTQTDQSDVRPDLAAVWPGLTDCKKVFYVSSVAGERVGDILDCLREEGDVMSWEREEKTGKTSVSAGR